MRNRPAERAARSVGATAGSIGLLLVIAAGCGGDGRELPPADDPFPPATSTTTTTSAFVSGVPAFTAPPIPAP